ncbi:MAG: CHAT domain-containing protein, partial [Planctomycetota bacterium]
DENDRPRPYTADALDLLDGVREESLTPYLKQLRADVLARLQEGRPAEPSSAVADPTGIAQIDAARQLILVGKWDAALAELDAPELAGATRSKALATLYRAVIAAESGQTTEAASGTLFAQAIEQLAGDPSDAYRARNNYANCLLVRAQDRLYNHAFQIASGVSYPLIRSLMDWRRSLSEYEAALGLADKLGPDRRAAVEMNVARLYALLADVIHTLDPPVAGERVFSAGHRAAASEAWRLASTALSRDGGPTDPVVRAAGYEILAQLAFRRGSAGECRRRIGQAMHEYVQAGALAGLEGGHRMLGLLCLREAEYAQDDASGDHRSAAVPEGRKQALQHLRLSHFLAEFLRKQIPADRIGLGRAGFFARRAYVNERLCELLIAEGEHAEALRYAELAKARGLEDVLAVGASKAAGRGLEARALSEILTDWPSDVAALEYFLGTQQAWLFVVDSSGEVKAHVLKDAWGRPLASRDLIARLRSFLVNTDHKASQMRERLASGTGFDHTWQYELHQLYRELVPEGVIEELRKVRTVLIAPHHILHYFPFVALVTEPDTTPRSADEMVRPRFLLDEAFNVCSVPSLSAWDLLRERPDRPIRQVTASGIVRFADVQPLPGVEKDLANLKAAFGEMVQTVLSDEEASEARAKEILNRGGLLFVATHGQSFADQPLSSYLMFHADEHNDGYLTAGEIYAQDVAADLVVMSACYSGLADRSPLPGDDLFGLQRALLYSGARSVVSGVWDVYDGTGPELMREFFGQLVAGQPVPAALSNAQRTMLNRLRATRDAEPWLHPYFWAVYTAVGDDRTRFATGGE